MALFRYLRPVDSVLDPHGPLLNAVPRGVIEEVNQELKKAETQPRKRGRYLFFTAEEKAKVARYGSSHGVLAAVKRFSVSILALAWQLLPDRGLPDVLVHMVASHARLDSELLHLEMQSSFTNFGISCWLET